MFPPLIRKIAEYHVLVVVLVAGLLATPYVLGDEGGPITHDLSPYRACGLNCLFVVAKWNEIDTTLTALSNEVAPRDSGDSSVADLERAALALGLDPVAARVEMEDLDTIPLPAIVHLGSQARQSSASHYVVLIGLHPQGVILIDPPGGATLHPYSEFAKEWTGVILAFPAEQTRKSRFLAELRRREFWGIWPIRLVVASPLGVLAWWLFIRKKSHSFRSQPRTSLSG